MAIELEEGLLSALLATEGRQFTSHDLSADLFSGARETIFLEMLRQYEEHGGFDLVTISEKIGLETELCRISGLFSSVGTIQHYATEIRKHRLSAAISQVRAWAIVEIQNGGDILSIAARATERAEKLNQKWGQVRQFNELEQAFSDILFRLSEQRPGEALLFGFDPVDTLTDGLLGGDNVILAARPSVGKTAFILGLLARLAKRGIKTVLFSCEMGAPALAGRILAQEAMRSTKKALRRPETLSREEAAELISLAPHLEDIAKHLVVVSTAGNSWQAIYIRARQEVKNGAKLIGCDYLQLLSDETGKADSRNQEIERISRSWKMLLRSCNVPGIMLSQLSRKCEEERRVPVLSDLRDSGSIEQDADIVWFLSHEYPKGKAIPDKEKVTLFQAKGRDHGVGYRRLRFRPEIQTFYDTEERNEE